MFKTEYTSNEDVLKTIQNFMYGLVQTAAVEETILELSAMMREMSYSKTRLLHSGDFVTASPSRFGCPFGEVTRMSQFGNQYGPDWVQVTWFKWNYVPRMDRDASNTIAEIVHRQKDRPAYELGVKRIEPTELLTLVSSLLPWREEMVKEQSEQQTPVYNPLVSTQCDWCLKELTPMPIWGKRFCCSEHASMYFRLVSERLRASPEPRGAVRERAGIPPRN